MGKLYPQMHSADDASKYTGTTTSDWRTEKGTNQSIDLILDIADPNGSTNYDAAPIGSLYVWILAGSVAVFVKEDATTWTDLT